MKKYILIKKGLSDKGRLIVPDSLDNVIDNNDQDWYASTYYFNEEHKQKFDREKSIKGIRDVTTDKIWFDFDSKENQEYARQDAITVLERLTQYGIQKEDVEIYFSGSKGFALSTYLDKELVPEQVSEIAFKIAKDTKTFDPSLYDAIQILRVPGTKHQDTGLYKYPLTPEQLINCSIETIKTLAKSLDNVKENFAWKRSRPTEDFYYVEKKVSEKKVTTEYEFNLEQSLKQKPSHWKSYKWALTQGFFESGERHNALMVIAATCRGLGYDKETTYYICKSALKKQALRTGNEEFNKEELWTNIIEESVFADGWEGGQYSPATNLWLRQYCEKWNIKWKDEGEEKPSIELTEMDSIFTDYAKNYDKNIIKFGLEEVDRNVTFSTSTLVGLLGQPGSGKTSVSLQYLHNASMNDIPSMFFSLDMGLPLVYSKLLQRKTGWSFQEVINRYRNDRTNVERYLREIKEEYRNVGFNFKSGQTVADMATAIKQQEERIGKKVRLVVIDYLELISGPYSDPTANGAMIANQLKELANDQELCVLLLLQTQKNSTSKVSDPLLSLKGVKGSSVIEQNCSAIVTLWREGYEPDYVDDDKYLSLALVKNRFGPLWKGDFSWKGVTGEIRSLTEEERGELADFKKRKKEERLKEIQESDGWN